MSEEEKLIDYLNSIDITRIFYDNPPHENHVGIGGAIQGLLDLYNKEKAKNKRYEKYLKNKDIEHENVLEYLETEKEKDYVSKYKIKKLGEQVHSKLDNNAITRGYQIIIDEMFSKLLEE